MTNDLRHKCRYTPHCGRKLDEAVDNKHHAFCSRGCHAGFYRKRCLVCEKPFAEVDQGRSMLVGARPIKRRATRRFCPGNKCAAEYRRNPAKYSPWAVHNAKAPKTQQKLENALPGTSPGAQPGTYPPTRNAKASKVPVKWAFKSGAKAGDGWRWEEVPGNELLDGKVEHWLVDGDGLLLARVMSFWGSSILLSPGIFYGDFATIEDAKRKGISLALARLPLEPKFAERIARLNELPPDPPQHLLPHTATYLAGVAAAMADAEAPSIVPDDMSIAADTDLEMPSFLERQRVERDQ